MSQTRGEPPERTNSLGSVICPVCRTEYAGWAPRCSTCGVALIPAGERIDVLSLPEESQVVYELTEWSLDQRTTLGEWLANEEVPHVWEDTDLIVADVDEGRVDQMCDLIEAGKLEDGGDASQVAYELDEWTTAQRSHLESRLTEVGVEYRWEPGFTLVVDPAHEATVDGVVDELSPDDAEEEDDAPEATSEMLGELFVAADILLRDPTDRDGVERLTAIIDDVDGAKAPYGMDRAQWEPIVDAADGLADAILDQADDDLVCERASALRTLVREVV
jgi:hypothetical protein